MFTNAYKNDSHREYITLSRSFKISTTKHWKNINNNNNKPIVVLVVQVLLFFRNFAFKNSTINNSYFPDQLQRSN